MEPMRHRVTDCLCTDTLLTVATRRRTSCTSQERLRSSDRRHKSVLDWLHGVTVYGLFYVTGQGDGTGHALPNSFVVLSEAVEGFRRHGVKRVLVFSKEQDRESLEMFGLPAVYAARGGAVTRDDDAEGS